ncbi:MAG: hypothetical protein ACOC5D_05480 [Thermoplasmatota archaeon]
MVEDLEKNSKNKALDVGNEEKLLIACYKKSYTEKSLNLIRKTIEHEAPSKIIVLKVMEEPEVSKKVKSRVGIEAKNDFLDSVIDEKKNKLDEISKEVLSITDKANIPVQVHLRKSKVISNKVLSEFKMRDGDHLIIPNTEKGPFQKLIEGSTKEKIKDEVGMKRITILD